MTTGPLGTSAWAAGAGWVDRERCGAVGRQGTWTFARVRGDSPLDCPGLVAGPVKNAGRFPQCAKDICAACALGLAAAGIDARSPDAAVAGCAVCGFDGVLAVNKDYFSDYVANGRATGRANLFIYTTPTSPMAEASILLGLRGPLLYVEADAAPCAELLETGREAVRGGQASVMACVWQDGDVTLCVALAGGPAVPALDEALRGAAAWRRPADGVRVFEAARMAFNDKGSPA